MSSDDEIEYHSDYENEEYYDDDDESVVARVSVILKKNQELKIVPLGIKYYNERDAFDAESEEYRRDMRLITPFINIRYPGWSIENIRSEGVSHRSSFDLDTTSSTNSDDD